MPTCSSCNKSKNNEDFHFNNGKPRSICKECNKLKTKQWEKEHEGFTRGRELMRKYWPHLSWKKALQEYQRLLELQNGVCAICGKPETAVDNKGQLRCLAVDHDHQTGTIRGLLCTGCNSGLGYFRDNYEILEKAKKYLKQTKPAIK